MEDLKYLYNKLEYNWYKVAYGELAEEEINELLFEFKNTFTGLENKNLKEENLLERNDFREKADRKTDLYFERNF